MRSITMFSADDGSRWDTAEQAMARDAEIRAVSRAMSPLPPLSPHHKSLLGSGRGFYQHRPTALMAAKRAVLELAKTAYPHYRDTRPDLFDPTVPAAYNVLGRILTDVQGPLCTAWCRLMRIDEQAREWEQPYFVYNPKPDAVAV